MKLDEICSIVRGSSPRPQGDARYYGGKIPRLMLADITRDGMFVTPNIDSLTSEGAAKSRSMNKGDVIIAVSGDPGRTSILNVDACIHDGFVGLRNLNTEKIYKPFLYYYLNFYKKSYKKNAVGAIFKNLTTDQIKKIELPEISREDQIHIANLLSKAEELISQRKESIRILDEFLKSTFLEMFGDPVRNEKGWEQLPGESYLEKLTVGVVIKPASYYVEKGIIALRSLNIRPNRIDLNNLVYFSEEANQNGLSKSILRGGDVVFVRTGMTGTAAVIPKELDGCNCIDLIITRPKKNVVHPIYQVFFFNSDFGKKVISSKEVGGIQKHFNIGAVRSIKIPIPPILFQNKFAQIVEKTESLKAQYQSSLKELENLYGSLNQQAFKGELRMRRKEEIVLNVGI